MNYGFSKEVSVTFEQAIEKVTEELKKVGFGVLTNIDVKDTLKKKLSVDFPKYIILGACNPQFAHKALQVDKQIGLLLPCNVIVYENNGKTYVSIFDPTMMVKIVEDDSLKNIAEEVKALLEKVLKSL